MQKIFTEHCVPGGLLWWLSDKESTCQCRRCQLDPWVRKISWRRKWQPTPALLPGKFHGQRSLLQSLGSQRVIHNWATKQQQQLCSRHCLGTRDTSRNLEDRASCPWGALHAWHVLGAAKRPVVWTKGRGANAEVRQGSESVKVVQSCLTLCDPIDYSLSGSSVHGILQARILASIALPFSRGSSQPRSPTLQVDYLPSEPPGDHIRSGDQCEQGSLINQSLHRKQHIQKMMMGGRSGCCLQRRCLKSLGKPGGGRYY